MLPGAFSLVKNGGQAESAVAKRFGGTSWESESGRKMKTLEVTIDDPQTCNGEPKI